MKIGSLFSGYGGLDMAAETVFGATPAWFCEFDPAPAKVLAHHWPDVPNYRDVTRIDWGTIPPVDIITGGYPCQPFSASGLRKGTTDERHLWPHVREAIRALRPRYIVLENVAGHLTLGLDTVLGEMAEDGLDAWWTCLRASDIGAPHHRDRVFILAAPADPDSIGLEAGRSRLGAVPEVPVDHHQPGALAVAGGREQPSSDGAVTAAVEARWARLTRPAPPPVEGRETRPFARFDWAAHGYAHMGEADAPDIVVDRAYTNPAYIEWMMGLPEGHVTSPGVGLSRAQQVKMLGNGVVPQQAAAAVRQLLAMAAPAGLGVAS